MEINKNVCGECRACCIILPIAEPGFVKAAGVPCNHLCTSGCSLYGSETMPDLCRGYYCVWRMDKWFENRPDYRPDKLGVILQGHMDRLTLFEVSPNSLSKSSVQYIKNRQRKGRTVMLYPYGIGFGVDLNPATIKDGMCDDSDLDVKWEDQGNDEYMLRSVSRRIPLHMQE